jgi:hypothetical protein
MNDADASLASSMHTSCGKTAKQVSTKSGQAQDRLHREVRGQSDFHAAKESKIKYPVSNATTEKPRERKLIRCWRARRNHKATAPEPSTSAIAPLSLEPSSSAKRPPATRPINASPRNATGVEILESSIFSVRRKPESARPCQTIPKVTPKITSVMQYPAVNGRIMFDRTTASAIEPNRLKTSRQCSNAIRPVRISSMTSNVHDQPTSERSSRRSAEAKG